MLKPNSNTKPVTIITSRACKETFNRVQAQVRGTKTRNVTFTGPKPAAAAYSL